MEANALRTFLWATDSSGIPFKWQKKKKTARVGGAVVTLSHRIMMPGHQSCMHTSARIIPCNVKRV